MIRLFALFVLLAGPALSDTARVYSGEHADFTRLVVELSTDQDWTLGRTPMGYGFATASDSQPVFDISTVWDRIPKSRLQALRTDPETGALQLTLACACHVFPFEYQPGVIVLDIKPGPAPEGSTFELVFQPPSAENPGPIAASGALPAYDWLDPLAARSPGSETAEIPLPTGGVSLDPLRAELLEEISRGAAQGVVDMALPGKPPENEPVDRGTLPWSQIHIGPPEDAAIAATTEGKEGRTPEGQACIADDQLALAEWGAGRPPLDLLAEARSGLYGEFDLLDLKATLHAVRLHLYLGFGAEAAQYAKLLSGTGPHEDLAILQSLSRLVEGETDPQSPFLNMLACDGAAALWAALAQAEIPPGAVTNSDAMVRHFLALPPHLRAALGAGLAERLLAYGDGETARIVRNAIERTPDIAPATVALLDAEADLNGGEPEAALGHATTAIAEDGNGVEEWIALVEAHFRQVEPMTPEAAEVLRSFEGEIATPDGRVEFVRALALAELLSGQTETGFRTAERQSLPTSDLWQVAASLAEDDAFLRQAIPAVSGQDTPDVTPEVAIAVARRLVELGFPDAALVWLGPTGPEDGADKRRVAAMAELSRGDARQTLALLAGLSEPEDEVIKARAMVQLGQISTAREAYTAAGLPDEALRLAAWEGAWSDLQAADAPLWGSAAAVIDQKQPLAVGPLARGAAIVEASASSRAMIEALLSGVTAPEP